MSKQNLIAYKYSELSISNEILTKYISFVLKISKYILLNKKNL